MRDGREHGTRRGLAGGLAAALLVCGGGTAAHAEPMTLQESGHLLIPVRVNGQGPFDFVVDTGASITAILRPLREQLGLQGAPAPGQLQGVSGAVSVPFFMLESLETDGRVKTKPPAVGIDALPQNPQAKGVIGADFISDYVADFDIPGQTFTLRDRSTDMLAKGSWTVVPFTLNEARFPVIQGSLDGKPVTMVLDTGARRSLINWAAARQFGVAPGDSSLRADPEPLRGITAHAIPAVTRDFTGLAAGSQVLAPQNLRIADVPVFQNFGMADKPAMILGMDKLSQLHLVVDYPRNRLLVERTGAMAPTAHHR